MRLSCNHYQNCLKDNRTGQHPNIYLLQLHRPTMDSSLKIQLDRADYDLGNQKWIIDQLQVSHDKQM